HRPSAIARLREVSPSTTAAAERPVVFMFPGQGAQYPGMAGGLYASEPVVRKAIDRCAKALKPEIDADLRKVLFPPKSRQADAADVLRNTRWAQPALFTVGYALASLWRSWGIEPAAMVGHSVGEYVAATLAGVMSLEDALRIIARRGRLIADLPRGSMLAVVSPAASIERFVGGDIALAAVNGPSLVVLSGPDHAIDSLEAALTRESIVTRRLHTSHAFHSSMMDPILTEFEDLVAGVRLMPPSIRFAATLTGGWANGDVTQPGYWSAQLRSTVRFSDAVSTIAREKGPLGKHAAYLEVGPGNSLATFVSETVNNGGPPQCLTSLPSPHDRRGDSEVTLGSLGQLWASGAAVDWEGFHRSERRRRASLPTYPFERRSYWVGAKHGASSAVKREARDTSGWFHLPVWRDAGATGASPKALSGRRVLVFDEDSGLGAAVAAFLRGSGAHPIVVVQGGKFEAASSNRFVLDPAQPDGYKRLAKDVCAGDTKLAGVIDCWNAAPPADTDLETAGRITMLAPMRLAHALSSQITVRPLPFLLVARGTRRIADDDPIDAMRALGLGVAKVIPQEHPGLRLAHIDVDSDASGAAVLVTELAAGAPEPALAFRGGRRLVETYEPRQIAEAKTAPDLPERPVVLVTGGLGHMGMILSEGIFSRLNARLALLGRSALPNAAEWQAASEDPLRSEEQRTLLARLARMHADRDDVLVVKVDMNDPREVDAAVTATMARFGRIDLIIHGAARIDAGAFAAAAETGTEVMEAQFSPKLRGLFHLMKAMRGREPRRWVLHSSVSTVLGGLGLAAYSAANAVLDAVAAAGGSRWLSIDWDLWENAAEAKAPGMPLAIQADEGSEAFLRLLGANVGTRALVVVSDLAGRLKAWVRQIDGGGKGGSLERHPRPNLTTAYVEPRTSTEKQLADIWG
ncbi:MAG: SDR family NAD(P)-dependent oxidoreductase, partial [Vicinamibacterales bacterium]